MTYVITALEVRDYQGIRHVRIEPPADTYLLIIGGPNEAGKSSILRALDALFGGKGELSELPVRIGAEDAEIAVNLAGDDGTYYVRRTVKPALPNGKIPTEIVIRGPKGIMKSPQAFLDRIVGQRTLDPSAFLHGTAPEDDRRRLTLLLKAMGIDTVPIDAKIKAARDDRAEVGRQLETKRAVFASIPAPSAKPEPARKIAEVSADLTATERELGLVSATRADAVGKARAATAAAAQLAALEEERRRLDARIAAARVADEEAQVARRNADDAVARTATPERERELQGRRAELQGELGKAETWSRWQSTSQADRARRDNAEADVRVLEGRYESETDRIASLEAERVRLLTSAPPLVPGLEITDDGLRYRKGDALLPFSQASQAIRTRVALAVGTRSNPELRVVWLREAVYLDEAAIEIVREEAEAIGCLVILERVGERDAGAIIIRDGEVAGVVP